MNTSSKVNGLSTLADSGSLKETNESLKDSLNNDE
jgi:hypothetical protein